MTTNEYDIFGLPVRPPLDASPEGKLHSGDEIHFLKSTSAWGQVWGRGDSIVLTAEMIGQTIDTRGHSWLDQIDDEDARIGLGDFPEDLDRWTPGTADEAMAFEAARREAHSLPIAADRAAALAALAKKFPAGVGSTSQELGRYYGGSGR
jgi:hypothetical protein